MATSDRTAMLFIDAATDGHILFIKKSDAKALHIRKLLQKIEGKSAYCAPRSWRQIAAGITPPLHRDVLTAAHLTSQKAIES